MAKVRKRTESTSVIDSDPNLPAAPPPNHDAGADGAEPLRSAHDTRDRVAMRAYELYLARGNGDGNAFDDWLAAEREVGDTNRHRSPRNENSE